MILLCSRLRRCGWQATQAEQVCEGVSHEARRSYGKLVQIMNWRSVTKRNVLCLYPLIIYFCDQKPIYYHLKKNLLCVMIHIELVNKPVWVVKSPGCSVQKHCLNP